MRNEGRNWEHPALTAARDRRPPTEADRPPPSLFPMTPAARASKAMYKREGKVQP